MKQMKLNKLFMLQMQYNRFNDEHFHFVSHNEWRKKKKGFKIQMYGSIIFKRPTNAVHLDWVQFGKKNDSSENRTKKAQYFTSKVWLLYS